MGPTQQKRTSLPWSACRVRSQKGRSCHRASLLQADFLSFSVEGRLVDAEEGGGIGEIPGLRENFSDVRFFECFQCDGGTGHWRKVRRIFKFPRVAFAPLSCGVRVAFALHRRSLRWTGGLC